MSPSASKRGVVALSEDDNGSPSSPASHLTTMTTSRTKKSRTNDHNAASVDNEDTTQRLRSRRRLNGTARSAQTPDSGVTRVVTPSQSACAPRPSAIADDVRGGGRRVRRALLGPVEKDSLARDENEEDAKEPKVKRRLAFGRYVIDETHCPRNVRDVYKIVGKLTGSVGGNGSFGAIYGELTMGSMQKIVQLMKMHTNFSSSSRFIDVGSGLGKPSLHVCQDPGVEFSYGIEMEMSRWMLGMANLRAVIKAAKLESSEDFADAGSIGSTCFFDHGNIMDATSFDPFTHVYMFSIGFPPRLWEHMSEMFNRSSSPYLICYHPPSDIIDNYGFNVKLVVQTPTSMHGSNERHMSYLYKRKGRVVHSTSCRSSCCDPLYKNGWEAVKAGLDNLDRTVESMVQQSCHGGRLTRSRGAKMTIVSKIEEKEEAGKQVKNA